MKSMKPQEPLIRVVDDEEEVRDSLKFMLVCGLARLCLCVRL